MCDDRFRGYELSFKSLSDLFDWWERATGMLAVTDQQPDPPDDSRAAKKGKKSTGFFPFPIVTSLKFFPLSVRESTLKW